jgi:hypothetical protein
VVTLGYAECKLCPEKEQFPDAMVHLWRRSFRSRSPKC